MNPSATFGPYIQYGLYLEIFSTMARKTQPLAFLFLACAVVAGCSEQHNLPSRTDSISAGMVDSCGIALTPHFGGGPDDSDILRFQQAARRADNPVPHLERLGWGYVTKARWNSDPGFYRLAEQTARCMEAKQAETGSSLLLRGHVRHQLHDFRAAESIASRLIEDRGAWFDYALLGDALMEQGKLTQAVDAYQRMMDQKPGPQAYSRAAHVRWLTGDLEGAIELMRMAAKASSLRDRESAAWTHVRLATYELQAGQGERAAYRLSRALSWKADYPPALLWRGRLRLARENYNEAVPPLMRAAELEPLPEHLWTLIEALRAAGRSEEANVVRAKLSQTGAVEDRRTFALYLATAGQDVHEAVRLAKQELKVRDDVFTLDALAWAQHAAGRADEAYGLMQRALAEGTRDARLSYHAGVIAAAAGQYAEARDWLDRALAIQQMLLPSERDNLAEEIAALGSRNPTLALNR